MPTSSAASDAVSAPATSLPRCPLLPDAPPGLDWSYLNAVRDERGPEFYLRALIYAQHLWTTGCAARAILAIDRALGADLAPESDVLRLHPLPYAAQAWVLGNTPADVFLGNPRVHFQHLADRVPEPRRALRSARYWACWHLARVVLPHLPGDPRHQVVEPTREDVTRLLDRHGHPGESSLWQTVLLGCTPARA